MNFRNRAVGVLSLSVVLLSACAPAPSPADPAPTPSGLTAGDHVFRTADGNEIPYTVTGEGDVTVVLVHCWMCDQTFWAAQVPELSKRYRTITLDLPGHGRATSQRVAWTVAAYGEDVAALLESLDLSGVVLVGHSMGGPVSLRAAALTKPRVRGVVAVDTLHDAEFDFSGPQVEGYLKAFETDYVGTCTQFIDPMVPESGVDEIRTKIRTTGCDPRRKEVGVALMRSFTTIDSEAWFSEAGVPIRAINAATPNPTQVATNRKYADFSAVLMEGVGHYPHMTRPAEFNPLLLEAISEIAGGPK